MAEVLLFHHAQSQTSGFLAFADELQRAGHIVHARTSTTAIPSTVSMTVWRTPGRSVSARSSSAGYVPRTGSPANLSTPVSRSGSCRRRSLAQTRPGAQGALLFHSCVPTSEFGSS